MNNEHEKTNLVGITLDLVLVALYGPEAPGKVRTAYDMFLARETARHAEGYAEGKQRAEEEAKRHIVELETQRDAAQSKLKMHEEKSATLDKCRADFAQRRVNTPYVTLPNPHQAMQWTPGLPPMQQQNPQHDGLNVDVAELQRLYNSGS